MDDDVLSPEQVMSYPRLAEPFDAVCVFEPSLVGCSLGHIPRKLHLDGDREPRSVAEHPLNLVEPGRVLAWYELGVVLDQAPARGRDPVRPRGGSCPRGRGHAQENE